MTPLQNKFRRLIRAAEMFDDAYYALYNPDAAARGGDLLEHYILRGEGEGRKPCLFFDPSWYRLQSPRLPVDGNLLAHCLTVGDGEGLQPYVGIDPAHVRMQFPRKREPALMLFARARASGRPVNPNRLFDYGWYLDRYPDVAAAGIDPYQQFVEHGADEGRLPSEGFDWDGIRAEHRLRGSNSEVYRQLMLRWREMLRPAPAAAPLAPVEQLQAAIAAAHVPGPHHEQPEPPLDRKRDCDVYAVYAPEFVATPEYRIWAGEGHNPWHRVIARTPAFEGHLQPRVPATLGFYDLDDPAVLRRQIALAASAGISGFAWRYYNFGGRPLFERPLERLREDPTLDIGFFLVWMNRGLARAGEAGEEVLLAQRYPSGFTDDLAADLARYVRDVRYRRVNGQPLFVIDSAADLPGPDWIDAFREACVRHGFAPLIFQVSVGGTPDPALDGTLALEPQLTSHVVPPAATSQRFGDAPRARVIDYTALAETAASSPRAPGAMIRSCAPSWDNSAQHRADGLIARDATPAAFERWLRTLVDAAAPRELVCVHGWNCWAEGACLEPDLYHGHAFLNAVRRVMRAA